MKKSKWKIQNILSACPVILWNCHDCSDHKLHGISDARRKSDIIERSANIENINKFSPDKMTADEFAFRVIDADNKLQIIDLRSPEDYKQNELSKFN
ncbi:MAG: hypothetical protein IPL53_07530 [Ignavibacteria bacterium]|nr:hypothetical protein [Ignavibacteria bacterium]